MGRDRKNKLTAVVVAFVLFMSLAAGAAEVVERIVALVGEEPILLSAFRKALVLKYGGDGPKAPRDKQEKVLDEMIENSLIEQKAKKIAIGVTDKELDDEIENVKKANNITNEVLVEALKKEGLTIETYRETLRSQILKAKIMNREVRSQVVVTDDLLRDYYEKEIAADRETLVDFDVLTLFDDAGSRLDEDIKEYYGAARTNKGLDEIVKSVDARYRPQLNNPRGIKLSSLSRELRDAMKPMKQRELGPLIRFKDGFQIFVFIGRKAEGLKPFDDIKEELKKRYTKDKLDKAYNDWLEELKKETYVEKRL